MAGLCAGAIGKGDPEGDVQAARPAERVFIGDVLHLRAAPRPGDGEGRAVLVEELAGVHGEVTPKAICHPIVVGLVAGRIGDDEGDGLDRQAEKAQTGAVALGMGTGQKRLEDETALAPRHCYAKNKDKPDGPPPRCPKAVPRHSPHPVGSRLNLASPGAPVNRHVAQFGSSSSAVRLDKARYPVTRGGSPAMPSNRWNI